MADKKSFVLSNDNIEDFMALTDEQAGQLIKVIFAYENGMHYEISDPVVAAVFRPIRRKLDANREAYEDKVEKRREAGAKGGRPKKQMDSGEKTDADVQEEENQTKAKKANGFSEKQSKAKKADTDTDTDTDIKEKEYSSSIPKRKPDFTPPTVADVQAYASEKKYIGFDAERFVAFYSSNGWKVGKNPMKDWRAAVVGWHSRDMDNKRPTARGKISDTTEARDLSFLEM